MQTVTKVFIVILTLALVSMAHSDNGLIIQQSAHNTKDTLDRFENSVRKKGMRIFMRIDHAQGAKKTGLQIRPTILLIFGYPKSGTLLMQSNQTAAIDLPMKALAWEDDKGKVWLAYNDPGYLANRHSIIDREKLVENMRKILANFAKIATAP